MDRRRVLLTTLAGALAGPFASRAESGARSHAVGILTLNPRSSGSAQVILDSLRQGFKEIGYREGENLVLEARFAEGNRDLLPALAQELLNLQSAVIVTFGTPATVAARNATTTEVRNLDKLEAAFKVARAQTDAIVVTDEALFAGRGAAKRIADVAVRSRVPTIGFPEFAEEGGLIGYGVDFPETWRRSMVLVDKVLKGTKPAELPIQQPTRFELVINLKTAKALGLTIPPSLLARADQVIQ